MPEAQPPQPPPGMQRPGIVGAGNLLDPAVRGPLREQVQAAMPRPAAPAAAAPPAARPNEPPAGAETPEPAPPPAANRAGPFPHGDVDLRGFAANVPPGPVRPQRGRAGRRFYFLTDATPTADAPDAPTAGPPDARKPG